MSRTFTLYNQSAIITVARLQYSSTVLPPILDISAQVLNRQFKGVLDILFKEYLRNLLQCLENKYKSKGKRSWKLCFCTNLILCIIVELLQIEIDRIVIYKISEKGKDPASAIDYSSSICKELEELPIKYS
jgi:hypothetical protein